MNQAIITKIKKLADINHSQYADNIGVTEGDKQTYDISLGARMGTFGDMVRIFNYLEQAGLSRNGLKPEVGDYGITTTQGHTTLGFGDGKGGFYDKVAMSDNVSGTCQPDGAFGLRVSLDGYPEKEILQKLDKAIHLQETDAVLKTEQTAGAEKYMQRIRTLDGVRDRVALDASRKKKRTETEDVDIVRKFITDTVHEFAPHADVKVKYNSNPDEPIAIVYGINKPTFTITIKANDENIDREQFADSVNMRIQGKMGYNPKLPVSSISSFQADGSMKGQLVGSAARVAAQIEGVDLNISKKSR